MDEGLEVAATQSVYEVSLAGRLVLLVVEEELVTVFLEAFCCMLNVRLRMRMR